MCPIRYARSATMISAFSIALATAGCPPQGTTPSAAFNGEPTSGPAPLSVQFTDTSDAGIAAITEWSWNFGDGGTSTQRNPSHTYANPGEYNVSLTVTASAGSDTKTKEGYITAEAQPVVELQLSKWAIETGAPNYVNILFQVRDSAGVGVTDLTTEDFRVLENSQPVSPTESNVEIKKQDRLPYTCYTVLMLDNSASVGTNLASIRTAAKTLVNGMGTKQRIAVYSFSDSVARIIDFTGIDGKQDILNAIDTIELGYPTTNLYGAAIHGVGLWTDRYELSGITQGALVLLTDGSDTQGSSTLEQALSARGSKRCYTIGLGAEINPAALESLGSAGYYLLADFTQLAATFAQIQADIDAYANSSYLLRYNSPKRGANNHNLSLYSVYPYHSNTLTGSFNSAPFYSVMPGVYVNDGYSNHNGICELAMNQGPGQQVILEVHTYFGAPGVDPIYTCTSSRPDVTRVASISGGQIVIEAVYPGTATLTIRDTSNGFETTIDVSVYAIVPDVSGLSEAAAVAALETAVLDVGSISYEFNTSVASGNVLSQNPQAGTIVAPNSPVALTVARYVTVPDVSGLLEVEAEVALGGAGLDVGTATNVYSLDVDEGHVIGTSPSAGTIVAPGTIVVLLVSLGEPEPETILLPGGVPLEMMWIPAGMFMMGRYAGEQDSNNYEDLQHRVTLASGFWMGKYEITQAQWKAVMGAGNNPSSFQDDNRPVEHVSWDSAQSFITELNTATGLTFRLPSEAEWEYACRAGTTTRFYWGDDLSYTDIGNYAWYNDNSSNQTHDVGTAGGTGHPNAFGLYDMSGNVWEWCQDWFHDSYTGAPADGSAWESPTSSYRVFRGGGCHNDNNNCRSVFRFSSYPDITYGYTGIRLAR